jgi:hypothetical protein
MTNQLPAYIANRQRDPNALSLAQRGLQNVGSGAGPYVSIEGNRFTLVDAAGGKQQVQTLFLDVCVIDINEHTSKMFYDQEWDPNNPTPPVCFSDNGIGPSTQASQPQALTCAACPNNVWGSKISKMGSQVKACRDEEKTAVIIPGMPNNIFRLTIPPNSRTNWRAYLAKFVNAGFDIGDVVTRLTFEPGVQGTLMFAPSPTPWLDDATVQVRDKALGAKASDMIVGRLDRPRQGLLAAPAQEQPRPLPAEAAGFAQPAGFPSTTMAQPSTTSTPVAQLAPNASPSEPQRRRRRTQAEIAAASGASGAQAPQMAPFRPEAQQTPQPNPPNGGHAPGPAFGVGQGVAPNPELQSAINSIFGT